VEYITEHAEYNAGIFAESVDAVGC